MQLTEVRINLCGQRGSRLKAFCSLTFDDTFVIRDVKLIDGNDGLFLAMPSRKLADHCPHCKEKNHLRARFCNQCGTRLNEERHLQYRSGNGQNRLKLHADIAHPINAESRAHLETRVLSEYEQELERSRQPGYVAPDLDVEEFDFYDDRPARSDAHPGETHRHVLHGHEAAPQFRSLGAGVGGM
ncbi:MAG TPA: SpoVG family protein [Tepidisphaeraceae bacterium]|nr:SpoVG family protein [Tepidisphaeraceae bacterium]